MDLLSARLGLLNRFIPFGGRNVLETVLSWYDMLWNARECIYCSVLIGLGRWVMDLVYGRKFGEAWSNLGDTAHECKGFQAVCYLSVFFKSLQAPRIPMDGKVHKLWIHVLPGGSAVRPTCNSGDMAGRWGFDSPGEWNGSLLWCSCLGSPMDSPRGCKEVIPDLATKQ